MNIPLFTFLLAKTIGSDAQIMTCFLICQVSILVAFYNFNKNKPSLWPWIMMFIVCMTYFFDTDYFSYKEDYELGLPIVSGKEPIYLLLKNYSFDCYTIWRAYIWGSALFLFYKIVDRFGIDKNTAIFILVVFATSRFAYGRVILAMACFFYGLSIIALPKKNKIHNLLFGTLFLCSSFLFHRSFLPIIAIAPLMLIKLNKKTYIVLLLLTPILSFVINYVFGAFLSSSVQMEGQFENFQASAERATSLDVSYGTLNWKAKFIYQAGIFSLIVPYCYIAWRHIFCNKRKIKLPHHLSIYFSASTIVLLIGVTILYGVRIGDTSSIGFRYLLMTTIPITILLAYLYQSKQISAPTLYKLILLGFLVFEGSMLMWEILHGFPI